MSSVTPTQIESEDNSANSTGTVANTIVNLGYNKVTSEFFIIFSRNFEKSNIGYKKKTKKEKHISARLLQEFLELNFLYDK